MISCLKQSDILKPTHILQLRQSKPPLPNQFHICVLQNICQKQLHAVQTPTYLCGELQSLAAQNFDPPSTA